MPLLADITCSLNSNVKALTFLRKALIKENYIIFFKYIDLLPKLCQEHASCNHQKLVFALSRQILAGYFTTIKKSLSISVMRKSEQLINAD